MALGARAVYSTSFSMPSTFAPPTYPIAHRIYGLAVLVLVLLSPLTSLAQSVDEGEVIRLAAENNPESEVFGQAIAVQDATSEQAALRQNPELSWEREHLPFGSQAESEDAVVLSVPINRSPSQKVARALARSEGALAQGAAVRNRSAVVRRALELFYVGIAQERRIEIEQEAGLRLAEAARIVARRREEGGVSGYDLARVQLESELAHSRVQEAKTAHASLRIQLSRMLGMKAASLKLSGSLQPRTTLDAPLASGESPALIALRAAAGFSEEASKQADRLWIPVVSVSAGITIAQSHDTNVGYVAGLSFPLPLWTESGAQRAKARAHHRLATAKIEAMRAQRALESAATMQTLQGLRTEAKRFREATATQVLALQRTAESGYREGERTLVELLDASRTRLSIQARQLELDLAIKQAEVLLRASKGEFE